MQERISVIIPIYNVEQYLERCLDSVCAQTYRNLEILLVDDGSKDRSGAICDEYAAKDERIRVFHKENGGSSSARNLGIREATGEYIGFVDSDDWIEGKMYESLIRGMTEHPECQIAQILSCWCDENGKVIEAPERADQSAETMSPKEYFRQLMLHVGDSSCCTKLFRTPFLKRFEFQEKKLNEDFEILLRMSLEMGALLTVRIPGYYIVQRSGSNTRGQFNPVFYESMFRNAEFAAQMGREHYPDLEPEVRHFYQVQAMWLLLHIPVEQMNRQNELYMTVWKRIRTQRAEIRTSPYLKPEFRRNLLILTAISPKPVRILHGWMMKLRGK